MSAPYLLWEERFDLSFEGSYQVHEFRTLHRKASVVGVRHGLDRAMDGKVEREYGVLLVKDRGFVANEHKETQSVLVIRRIGDLTPLPDTAGALLGTFWTDHGQNVWYVFAVRFPESPPLSTYSPVRREHRESPSQSPSPKEEPAVPPSNGSQEDSSAAPHPPLVEDSVWP